MHILILFRAGAPRHHAGAYGNWPFSHVGAHGFQRGHPEIPIESCRPFRANHAIPHPYSIDQLAELPRLYIRFIAHLRKIIGHFLCSEFAQSTTRKLSDEGLFTAHMPLVERRLNPLIVRAPGIARPKQTRTRGPVVIRHDNTSVFIDERMPRWLQENCGPSELCPRAIRNRPITNMADSA